MQATAYGKKSAITSQNKVQYSQTQQHVLNSIFRADGPCPDLLPTYQLKPQSAAYAIDLGTTRSVVAQCTADGALSIAINTKNTQHERLIASEVAKQTSRKLSDGSTVLGRWLVEQEARDARDRNQVVPGHYFDHLKQIRRKNTVAVEGNIKNLLEQKVINYPVDLTASYARITVDGDLIEPHNIEQYIGMHAVGVAIAHFGEVITEISVACPAQFDISQIKATKQMFEAMGIKVIGVVAEPACAFLYHALLNLEMQWDQYYDALRQHNAIGAVKPSGLRPAKILVLDVGGGTTDISMHHITKFEAGEIVSVASNKTFLGADDSSLVPTKADLKALESHQFIKLPVPNEQPCYGLLGDGTTGDVSLGGDKWTIRLMHEYAPDIQKSTGVDVIALATLQNKKQHYKLLEHFHKAKEQLTSEEEYILVVDDFYRNNDNEWQSLQMIITRKRLEQVIRPDVERIVALAQQCLDQCYRKHNLAEEWKNPKFNVVLAGGVSKTPLLQELILAAFGPTGSNQMQDLWLKEPDEAIARGAAVHAAIKMGLFREHIKLSALHNVEIQNSLGFGFAVDTQVQRRVTNAPDNKYYAVERSELSYLLQAGMTVPAIFYKDFVPITLKQTNMTFTCFTSTGVLVLPKHATALRTFKVECKHGKSKNVNDSSVRVFFYMDEDRVLDIIARDANNKYSRLSIDDFTTAWVEEVDEVNEVELKQISKGEWDSLPWSLEWNTLFEDTEHKHLSKQSAWPAIVPIVPIDGPATASSSSINLTEAPSVSIDQIMQSIYASNSPDVLDDLKPINADEVASEVVLAEATTNTSETKAAAPAKDTPDIITQTLATPTNTTAVPLTATTATTTTTAIVATLATAPIVVPTNATTTTATIEATTEATTAETTTTAPAATTATTVATDPKAFVEQEGEQVDEEQQSGIVPEFGTTQDSAKSTPEKQNVKTSPNKASKEQEQSTEEPVTGDGKRKRPAKPKLYKASASQQELDAPEVAPKKQRKKRNENLNMWSGLIGTLPAENAQREKKSRSPK